MGVGVGVGVGVGIGVGAGESSRIPGELNPAVLPTPSSRA
jgi:hypothetical protein